MNKRLKKMLCTVLCAVMALVAVGCSTTPASPAASGSANGEALTKVRVVLDYAPNTNHTGLYVAKEKGYFQEAGLDVEIVQPGEGTVTTIIAAGQGDFGISYQEDVTFARTSDSPLPIVAIGAILQHNTSGFASAKDKNITRPKDFEGKTYAGWGSPAEEATIKAVMERDGGDFSKLTIVQATDADFTTVIQSQIDLMWIYYGWDGIAAEMKGLELNYQANKDLNPDLDFYTPVIISSEAYLQKNPEIAKAFMGAVAKGYKDCVADAAGCAEILHKYAPDYDMEMLTKSQQYLNDYILDAGKPFGVMEQGRWDSYTKFMLDNGVITKDMDSTKAFTNEYLPEQ